MTQDVDIKLIQSGFSWDIGFADNGDFQTDQGLDTSIIMSLSIEARATAAQVPVSTERRGWPGDQFNGFDDYQLGSLVWIYEQAKKTSDTINGISDQAGLSLGWMVEDNIAVSASATGRPTANGVGYTVELQRANGQPEQLYYEFWNNTGLTNGNS